MQSWLLDLLSIAFKSDPTLRSMPPVANESGEAKWMIEAALELGVPTPATAAALYARQTSRGGADDILRVVSTMRAVRRPRHQDRRNRHTLTNPYRLIVGVHARLGSCGIRVGECFKFYLSSLFQLLAEAHVSLTLTSFASYKARTRLTKSMNCCQASALQACPAPSLSTSIPEQKRTFFAVLCPPTSGGLAVAKSRLYPSIPYALVYASIRHASDIKQ